MNTYSGTLALNGGSMQRIDMDNLLRSAAIWLSQKTQLHAMIHQFRFKTATTLCANHKNMSLV
jgi:hypothetical protein